jgi:hypothetical protein
MGVHGSPFMDVHGCQRVSMAAHGTHGPRCPLMHCTDTGAGAAGAGAARHQRRRCQLWLRLHRQRRRQRRQRRRRLHRRHWTPKDPLDSLGRPLGRDPLGSLEVTIKAPGNPLGSLGCPWRLPWES